MGLLEWAKTEVRIASEHERKASGTADGEWDYGCACYDSALKAFESLCSDGHSGCSIAITKNILNRLIDGKVLTPIEDADDVWRRCSHGGEKYTTYQCTRMSSFFKDVYDDGTVKYHDNDRLICVDIHDPQNRWHNGFVSRIYNEMFPITMPYMPHNSPAIIYCEEFLTDRKNGDFDTLGVIRGKNSDGSHFDISRYFEESEHGWKEIDKEEYEIRRLRAKALRNEEENNNG